MRWPSVGLRKKEAKRRSRHLALAGGAAIVRREWTLGADHKPRVCRKDVMKITHLHSGCTHEEACSFYRGFARMNADRLTRLAFSF